MASPTIKNGDSIFRVAQKIALIALDPLILVNSKVLRRTEEFARAASIISGLFNFVVWSVLWLLMIFLNDWSKPNFINWVHYRLQVVVIVISLGVFFWIFKNKPLIRFVCIFTLGLLFSTAYSWSYSLGLQMPREFISLLSFLVFATSFRSYLLTFTSQLLTLLVSHYFWASYVPVAWVFTDFEMQMFALLFLAVGHYALIVTKANDIAMKDVEGDQAKRNLELYEQITRFISPVIVKKINSNDFSRFGISHTIDQLLLRKKTELSVLYSDWRGFSKRSDESTFIENELIPSTAKIIDISEKNEGVSRQTADAVLTFYPSFDKELSLLMALKSGVQCALYESERCRSKEGPDRFFIITSGQAYIGNMASSLHREFTIIGRPANLSARIDEVTKEPFVREHLNTTTSLLLDESSFIMLNNFADGFEFNAIDLTKQNISIRSFEDVRTIYLFPVSNKNLDIINALLKLNEYETVQRNIRDEKTKTA